MQNLLVVDTSSSRSVLAVKTEEKFIDRTEPRRSAHSRDILCRLQNIILEAGIELSDLDCIIFGCGPGSYTGIRITVGVVQGLSYGLDIPVVSVSSLEALAYCSIEENSYSLKEGNKILVSILARANEYFLGAYEWKNGSVEPILPEKLVSSEELYSLPEGNWFGIGNTRKFRDEIKLVTGVEVKSFIVREYFSASSLLKIGQTKIEAEKIFESTAAIPKYLKEVIVG